MSGSEPATAFATVARHHGLPWTVSASPAFGANALRVRGKIFAALTRDGQLLLKLPAARVDALVAARRAMRFVRGGRTMNGWATIALRDADAWVAMSQEAHAFVRSETDPRRRSADD